MPKGTVVFFDASGGYGFIETDEADDDAFFHVADVGGPDIEESEGVEFAIEQADEGPRATDTTRV